MDIFAAPARVDELERLLAEAERHGVDGVCSQVPGDPEVDRGKKQEAVHDGQDTWSVPSPAHRHLPFPVLGQIQLGSNRYRRRRRSAATAGAPRASRTTSDSASAEKM